MAEKKVKNKKKIDVKNEKNIFPKKIDYAEKDWEITAPRFVAFLDILGFKDSVMRNPHEAIYNQLKTISKSKTFLEKAPKIAQIKDTFNEVDISIVNFSDSIVIFSESDNEDNFKYFLASVRYLFAEAIKEGIPLKGGMAHGVISFDRVNQIYFGQPIIDAFLMEEELNYFGIYAHHTIEDYIFKNKIDSQKKFYKNVVFELKTPLKCGKINHLNINWFILLIPSNFEGTKAEKKKLIYQKIKDFNTTVSGPPRKYVDNTLDLIEAMNIEKYI